MDTHLGQESQVLLLEELWGRGRGKDPVLRFCWKTREIERWWEKWAGHWLKCGIMRDDVSSALVKFTMPTDSTG